MGDIICRLMTKIKELYKKEKGAFPDPILNLVWNYTDEKGMYDPVAVAKAINGYFLEDITIGDKSYKKGECVPGFANLQADGKTSCGNWIHSGSFTADGTNLIARRKKDDPTGLGLFPEWGWAWPVNRRILYNRASVDKNGQPLDPSRPILKWADGKWVGDVPDGPWPPLSDKEKGKLPFIMKPDGVSSLFGPGLAEGPFPEHYEPLEGPLCKNLMSAQLSNPVIKIFSEGMRSSTPDAIPNFPLSAPPIPARSTGAPALDPMGCHGSRKPSPRPMWKSARNWPSSAAIKNGETVMVESPRGKLRMRGHGHHPVPSFQDRGPDHPSGRADLQLRLALPQGLRRHGQPADPDRW